MSFESRLKFVSTALLVMLVAGFGAAFFIYDTYGGLIDLNNRLSAAHLKYETDLRPLSNLEMDLIELASEFTQEHPALDSLEAASENARRASRIHERVIALNRQTAAIEDVVRTVNRYPQLRTSPEFREWRSQFEELESEIHDSRQEYNDSADLYNARIHSFPGNLISILFGLPERPLITTLKFPNTAS